MKKNQDRPDWLQFEEEMKLLAEQFGYRAETTRASGDGGVDVISYGPRGKVIIQCKLFAHSNVGGPVIDQLAGACAREQARHAICITTRGFTKQAIPFAQQSGILLVDGVRLLQLCRQRQLTVASHMWLEWTTGETLAIPGPRAVVGRGPTCDLVIAHHTVSRRHAVLERDGLRLWLKDCGSTNGTFINGERLSRPRVLTYGDEMAFGTCALRVAPPLPGVE